MDFSTFDLGKVKDMARKGIDKARQIAEGLNELEMKVEEATNNDKWGPHGSLMSEITKRSYHGEEYKQVLGILARRLHSEPNHWRHVYKSLLLLEYMSKNGPQKIIPELKSNAKVFTRLQKFEYIDSQGKDQGMNVRNRAKQLWELVHDDDAIARERETAAKNRNKYTGYDRNTAAFSGRSGFGSSTSSRPESPTPEAFKTAPKPAAASANGAASAAAGGGPADADAVTATEARISKLAVADDAAAADAAAAPAARMRPKPKLSQISADSSIAGSIAAMAQKLPTPAAAAVSAAPSSTGADDLGLNLLDFGDDDSSATPAQQPAGADGAAAAAAVDPLAMLDELTAPPAAAGAGGDDWAPFADAGGGSAAAEAAGGDDDWAAFVSSNGTTAAAPAAPAAGEWDAFAGAGAAGGGGGAFADPFAPAVPASAPAAVAAAQAGGRAPLPMDAFMAPAVEPIPVASPAPAMPSPLPMGATTAGKPSLPDKDPFADLLG